MLIFDVIPFEHTPPVVMVAQGHHVTAMPNESVRKIGVCSVVPNVASKFERTVSGVYPEQVPAFPYSDISAYFKGYEGRGINRWEGNAGPLDTSLAKVVQKPAHGVFIQAKCEEHVAYCEHRGFYYKPDAGYFGRDLAIIDGEVNGWKATIHYYFHSVETTVFDRSKVCGKRGSLWKISAGSPVNPDISEPGTWQRNASLSGQIGSAAQSFASFTISGVPLHKANVMLAAAKLPKADRVVKLCQNWGSAPEIEAEGDAKSLYVKGRGTSPAEHALWVKEWNALTAKRIQLVEKPLYGSYTVSGDDPTGVDILYKYIPPSRDFKGEDRWSFLVELSNGKSVLVRYQMSPGSHDLDACKSTLLGWADQTLKPSWLSADSEVRSCHSCTAGPYTTMRERQRV